MGAMTPSGWGEITVGESPGTVPFRTTSSTAALRPGGVSDFATTAEGGAAGEGNAMGCGVRRLVRTITAIRTAALAAGTKIQRHGLGLELGEPNIIARCINPRGNNGASSLRNLTISATSMRQRSQSAR
jgi:hypothetical protein